MALPNPVTEQPITQPRPRGTLIVFEHDGPPAVVTGTYLGGLATGQRVIYHDLSHYVWWAAEAPPFVGYGAGAYGAGPYGEG